MDSLTKVSILLGKTLEKSQSATYSDNVTKTTGIATSDSKDGYVEVDLGGYTLSDNGQSVELPTTCVVEKGDTVQVEMAGADQSAKRLMVTGVVGGGDKMAGDITKAQESAKEATVAANNAKTEADKAAESATKAQASADAATASANSAIEKANTASTAASDAKKAADSATTSANDAVTKANAAAETATKAQTSADSAATAAANAQTSADAAKTSAEKAQTTADNAATAASKAQSSADAATSSATTANGAATAAAAAAQTAQDAAEAAKKAAAGAQADIDEEKTYFWHDDSGAHVRNSTTGYQTNITADGVTVSSLTNGNDIATYATSGIKFDSGTDYTIGTDSSYVKYTASDKSISIVAGALTSNTTDNLQDQHNATNTSISNVASSVSDLSTKQKDLSDQVATNTQNINANTMTAAKLQQTADSINIDVSTLKSTTAEQGKTIESVNKHFQFADDGLTISNSKNSANVTLNEKEMVFKNEAGQSVATFSEDVEIKDLKIKQGGIFTMDNFAWVPRSNGNLSIKYIGGDS